MQQTTRRQDGLLAATARVSRHGWRAIPIVAALLGGTVVALLTGQLAMTELSAAADARLADMGVRVNDTALTLESEHLVLLRAISFTNGFPEALAKRDAATMQPLVTPLQANAGTPIVDVVDTAGTLVLAVRGQGASPPEASRAGWPAVSQALAGERDELGERWAGLVAATDGPLIATAGPVRLNGAIVGAVVVATPLADLLNRVAGSSPVGLTVYTPDGSPLATNFDPAPPALAPDKAAGIAGIEGSYVPRNVAVGPAAHRELLGRLIIRRQAAAILGVALPDEAWSKALAIALPVWLAVVIALQLMGVLARRLIRGQDERL